MRLSALAALMILTTVVLSACTQDTVAALDDHSSQFFGRGHVHPRMTPQIASSYPPTYPHTSSPAYSPVNPANLSNYAATTPTISTDAVTASDLPPPSGLMAAKKVEPAYTPLSTTTTSWDWPVSGKVVKDFAAQGEGIIIAAPKGTAIHAASSGEVAYVGSQMKDYGNLVIVRHVNGDMSSYAHASEILVAKGDKVKQGDVLGYVGQTGRAPQPQLHFAVRSGERTVDPLTRLPHTMASN